MRCAECNRPIKATSSAFIKRPGVAYGPVCSYRLFGWVKREKRERKFNLLRRSPAKTIQTIGKQYAAECVQAGQLALEGFAA